MWLLPFLNVYGTATGFTGEASDIQASIIGFPPVIPSNLAYKGSGVGAGFTAAFGYRAFFASYDFSYHWQFMKLPSNTVKVTVQGPRVGIQFTPWGFQGNVYVGAMRESIFGRQTGTIRCAGPGLGRIRHHRQARARLEPDRRGGARHHPPCSREPRGRVQRAEHGDCSERATGSEVLDGSVPAFAGMTSIRSVSC